MQIGLWHWLNHQGHEVARRLSLQEYSSWPFVRVVFIDEAGTPLRYDLGVKILTMFETNG